MNSNSELDSENVIGMYLLGDVHDGEVDRILANTSSTEFDAILDTG
ncbi:MAG: hypothetical protein RLZ42_801, partial [Armatimonadota bacterium]